ncbi:uncharacterized protein [Pyrus communis]|uniref:uncharacterized protein n=1 Tax=Pyrus communis TaxID=23211 RepID=UPI0035C17EC4
MAVRAGVMACEETEEQPQWDGSVAGHSYKPRNREIAHETLTNNYFNSNSKKDKAGHASFSTYQKVTIALQMLAYASPADAMNDTYGMSESTCLDNLAEFCHTVVQIYKEEYLGEPNQADMARLFRKAEDRGFLGMIRSLDCMH